MATLGFTRDDFGAFAIEGFSARLAKIYELVRPKLIRLGGELAPELARRMHMEFFLHVARHMRRAAPPESQAAFGQSPKGYKRYPYLALCISGAGIHARAVVKPEADGRAEMAENLAAKAASLEKSFRGTRIGRYDKWDRDALPAAIPAERGLFVELASGLEKKTGGLDVGFGWPLRDALRLERGELIDAYRELEPLYRILRAVA
ncbi:MAG TPA: DUF1054 family protein [Candidatus Binataceae bacterium]